MSKDQINLEIFFGSMLEDYKSEILSKDQATGALVAFTVALNEDNFEEARHWANQGRKLAHDLISLDMAKILLSRPAGDFPH